MCNRQKSNLRYPTIVFFIFLAVWIVWAFDLSTQYVTPGLLDDGTYIHTADEYRVHGLFHVAVKHFLEIFNSASRRRFYELHEGLLGFYQTAFGLDLRFWYLAQYCYCILTAAAGFWLVWSFSKDLLGGMLAVFSILTVSPLADAVRANFGKVEDVMAFTFMLAVACLAQLRLRSTTSSTILDRAIYIALAVGASIFMVLGSLGKESGKILAAFPLLFVTLEFVAFKLTSWHKYRQGRCAELAQYFFDRNEEGRAPTPLSFIIFTMSLGILVLAFSIYAFRLRSDTGYLANYFKLNFDPKFILGSVKTYWVQCPDVFILFVFLIPMILFGYVKPRLWACCVAIAIIAFIYLVLLMTFRFHVSYYLYIPAVLIAAGFGLVFACSSRRYRIILLVALALSRAHSIPYIYFQAAGQRYVDFVNFKAMEAAASSNSPRVIALDIDEQSQIIQEWNFLRLSYFGGKLPPIFGGPPNFTVSNYQSRIRSFLRSPDDAENLLSADSVPRLGDLVVVRSGSVVAGSRELRAVFPFAQNAEEYLSILDQSALVPFAEVGGYIPDVAPLQFGVAQFNLHWNFYRVASPLHYVIFGRQLPGWLQQDAHVRILNPDPNEQLALKIEIPSWVPYRYPLKLIARMENEVIEQINITGPGYQTLILPMDRRGDIEIEASDCTAPHRVGIVSTNNLCYLLKSAAEERRQAH